MNKTVAIYLTDGYGPFPDPAPKLPTLWVVTPGGLALEKFPFGERVRLLPSLRLASLEGRSAKHRERRSLMPGISTDRPMRGFHRLKTEPRSCCF